MSQTDIKRRLFICFLWLGKKVTKLCFSKEGILWRFVIKICLIKRSTEVIRTQCQNFLQDPHRTKFSESLTVNLKLRFIKLNANKPRIVWKYIPFAVGAPRVRVTTLFDLITTHTPISALSHNSVVLQITASVLFVYFFIKAYLVGTHLNWKKETTLLVQEPFGPDSVMNLGLYVNLLGPPAWPLIQWYYAWGPCKLSNVQAMYI